jgi:hypothetical protein
LLFINIVYKIIRCVKWRGSYSMFLLLCPSMPDHHLTTTVQWCCKISEKPVVTTNNGLFLVLGIAVQNQQNLRSYVWLNCPAVVLRRQMPGVRIPSGALKKRLLHKEKIQVQQPPVLMKEKRREYPVTGSVQTVPQ